ncbi:hypothetical protein [Rhizobium bangladeshense]|uniref:hypothetical protein n=1 Tax=Rhizobium bangladeshense TaxID=1138189 RepID=UPI0007E5650E|nr:hypothetical protein [Rhizobium bangladeshense]
MLNSKYRHRGSVLAIAIIAFLPAASSAAASSDLRFFDAALCSPPYSMMSATEIYDAAEKLAKPETSSLGAAIYKIPHKIGRDGFDSDEVIFANSAVGILIKGLRSEELAAKYDLKPENSKLLGTSSKGFSRELPEHLQPAPGLAGPGKVSIVAREGNGLEGKTLLACEFVPD